MRSCFETIKKSTDHLEIYIPYSYNISRHVSIFNHKNLFIPPQSPSQSQDDVNSPSDNNKEEDEASEDESDERIDQASYDPERLKAFNVRQK